MPPLHTWLGAFHNLTTLAAGATVQYEIELYLPTTAGNPDQGKTATHLVPVARAGLRLTRSRG